MWRSMIYMANTKHNQKHSNQVRIIGGQCRGRKLTFASAEGLRPTPDMVREKLFNWLGQDLTGLAVLDVFSGSGLIIAIVIGLHNVPEGMAVSVPLIAGGMRKSRAIWVTASIRSASLGV